MDKQVRSYLEEIFIDLLIKYECKNLYFNDGIVCDSRNLMEMVIKDIKTFTMVFSEGVILVSDGLEEILIDLKNDRMELVD